MRQIRLRLRTSVIFILATVTIFVLTTLYTAIWSTGQLEREEEQQHRDAPIPPGVIPFWSAINHQNIYDLHATPANALFARRSNITQHRVEELYQLIRNARTDETHAADKEKLFPIDPKWNFEKLVEQQQTHSKEEAEKQNVETHPDAGDSAAKALTTTTTTTTTVYPDVTTTPKTVGEYDKVQLRNYIHHVLATWKKEHQNDKTVTLASLVHDELLRDEPG
jgi:hypothetical protein